MDDKKKYIKWSVVAVIFIILYILFALFVNNWKFSSSNNYILVGNYLIWHENKGKYYQLQRSNDTITKNKFTVYDGKKEITDLTAQYSSNDWLFFDKNYNQKAKNYKFAYSGNSKVNSVDYITSTYEDNDYSIINNALKKENTKDILIKNSVKYSADFDGDGKIEDIYTTSNMSLVAVDYSIASYMFLVKDNKVVDIKKAGNNTFNIMEIVDINNDQKAEIIVGRQAFNNPTFNLCYQMYNVKNNKLTLKQDCLYENKN